jgi:hypothetical protein
MGGADVRYHAVEVEPAIGLASFGAHPRSSPRTRRARLAFVSYEAGRSCFKSS